MLKTYNATFPYLAKSNVNGPCMSTEADACATTSDVCCPKNDPVYAFLKEKFPGAITWNYGKFLVDKTGTVVGNNSREHASNRNMNSRTQFNNIAIYCCYVT